MCILLVEKIKNYYELVYMVLLIIIIYQQFQYDNEEYIPLYI